VPRAAQIGKQAATASRASRPAPAGLSGYPCVRSRYKRSLGRCKLLGGAARSDPGVQNLVLAARSLGLGATLTVWHLFLRRTSSGCWVCPASAIARPSALADTVFPRPA